MRNSLLVVQAHWQKKKGRPVCPDVPVFTIGVGGASHRSPLLPDRRSLLPGRYPISFFRPLRRNVSFESRAAP